MFREVAGGKTFSLELPNNSTIEELIEALKTQVNEQIYKKIKDLIENKTPGLVILLNGRNIVHLQGLKTKISEKDRIDIFPPGAGGDYP